LGIIQSVFRFQDAFGQLVTKQGSVRDIFVMGHDEEAFVPLFRV
jgi:hypothetical protein